MEIEERVPGTRLTIVKEETYIAKNGKKDKGYLCRCDCGNEKVIRKWDLNSGKIKSCGCLMTEFNKKTKAGNDYWRYRKPKEKPKSKKSKDKSKERLRRILKNMKSRCYNPNFADYKNYGARGIKICDLWIGENGFKKFYKWAIENGYADNLTIDRINNDGDYEPNNCRWITNKEQQYNKRTGRKIEYNGIVKTRAEWSEILGISASVFDGRIKKKTIR